MTVAIVIAAIVVVAAVVFVAIGRGGELSVERSDYAPLELGPVSATDVVLLRPPTALWGYNVQATDEAFEQIADSIRQRDIRIVSLEQLVTDLSKEPAPPPAGDPYVGVRRRPDQLESREANGGGWQTETKPATEWQAETQPANGWQTETQPANEWQTGTQPTADWPASQEEPPEQSHD